MSFKRGKKQTAINDEGGSDDDSSSLLSDDQQTDLKENLLRKNRSATEFSGKVKKAKQRSYSTSSGNNQESEDNNSDYSESP